MSSGGGRGEGGPSWLAFDGSEPSSAENAVCLGCHAGGAQLHWSGSVHERRDGRCTDCHVVMEVRSERHLLSRPTQSRVCGGCHVQPRSQMRKSAHMPTREGPVGSGWMDCGACHNPHGTVARSLVSAHTINDNCYSCHADKRGPYVYEHAPVNESCLNCHDPHGSLNPAMLRIAPPRLCQSCHISTLHPSESRSPTDRMVIGRSCGSCHVAIHGSNHPSGFALTR